MDIDLLHSGMPNKVSMADVALCQLTLICILDIIKQSIII